MWWKLLLHTKKKLAKFELISINFPIRLISAWLLYPLKCKHYTSFNYTNNSVNYRIFNIKLVNTFYTVTITPIIKVDYIPISSHTLRKTNKSIYFRIILHNVYMCIYALYIASIMKSAKKTEYFAMLPLLMDIFTRKQDNLLETT